VREKERERVRHDDDCSKSLHILMAGADRNFQPQTWQQIETKIHQFREKIRAKVMAKISAEILYCASHSSKLF